VHGKFIFAGSNALRHMTQNAIILFNIHPMQRQKIK